MQIEVCEGCILGLREDGSVLRWGGEEYGLEQVDRWTEIRQLLFCAGYGNEPSVFGLKNDGTVVSTSGAKLSAWCDVEKLVSARGFWVAGLKKDGTVVATEKGELWNNEDGWGSGWLDLADWRGITDIVPLEGWTAENGLAGICEDGTVRVTPDGYCRYTESWTDITALCSVIDGVFGLKRDGTLVYPPFAQELAGDSVVTSSLLSWDQVVSLTAGYQDDLFAVKQDGTVETESGPLEFFFADPACSWEDIQALYPACDVLIGLRTDGTLVCASSKDMSVLSSWKDIRDLRLDNRNMSLWVLGIKTDGTAVFAEFPNFY